MNLWIRILLVVLFCTVVFWVCHGVVAEQVDLNAVWLIKQNPNKVTGRSKRWKRQRHRWVYKIKQETGNKNAQNHNNVAVGGNLVEVDVRPWTTTVNFTVTVPTSLLTEQMYCPWSTEVTDVILRKLPTEGGWVTDGVVQVYTGLGFPVAEQFSCRGFPSVMVIDSGCDDLLNWGL